MFERINYHQGGELAAAMLRRYRAHVDMNCPECGYEGKVGYIGAIPLWYASWVWRIVLSFTLLGTFVALYIFFTKRKHMLHFGRCPNCGNALVRRGLDAEVSTLKGATEFASKPPETDFDRTYGICEYDFIRNLPDDRVELFMDAAPKRLKPIGVPRSVLRRDASLVNQKRAKQLVAEIESATIAPEEPAILRC